MRMQICEGSATYSCEKVNVLNLLSNFGMFIDIISDDILSDDAYFEKNHLNVYSYTK